MQENQRIALTKRLLKEGLLRILKKKNIEKVNVSELCAEAGINRATFYRHYEMPADVLHDIEKDIISDINILEFNPKNIPEIKKELERICTYIYERSEMAKILLRNSNFANSTELLEMFCKQLLATKYADNLDEESARLIVISVAGGGSALLKAWMLEDIKKTPKEMADLIIRFIEYGKDFF